jgi:hypothetical protein
MVLATSILQLGILALAECFNGMRTSWSPPYLGEDTGIVDAIDKSTAGTAKTSEEFEKVTQMVRSAKKP